MRFKLPALTPAPRPEPEYITEEKLEASDGSIDEKQKSAVVGETDSDIDSTDFQKGVKEVQGAAQMWTKNQLILAYGLIWVIHFILALSSGISGSLTPYITSAFAEHSLTATTNVVSSMISGLIVLPYAKLINVWGRPQGFALMVGAMTIGLILMAACQNVETFCAAQVFYYVGQSGIYFSLSIFIADTTSLRNRAFMIAFTASPWIATVWAYGPAAQSILNTIGFRWGFGIWAIVVPVTCFPLFALFYYNLIKARKAGLIPKEEHNRTAWENFLYYCKEFDVIGLLLIIAGLALFLLSFNLYAKQPLQWKSPLIICFIVIGGLLIIAFGVWEKYFAPITFIPWKLMMDRTVFFTYTMAATLYMGWYLWDSYFYSYLLVVYELSIADASYITNIYTIGSTFWSLVMGVVIRYNGRLKWLSLYFGVPITILGVGLMIHFRQPDVNIGFIVMCQIFIAFGGGTLVICEQMTVMAVASHQYVPAVLSMENMIISIGSAIGSTVAAALWQGVFPQKLGQYLPAESQADLTTIYGDIVTQMSYPAGSATKDAINRSYSETQRLMLITATCLYSITLVSVMFWKDVDVKHLKKVKGLVF